MTSAVDSYSNWPAILNEHALHYPLSKIQDWYKLIYQGTLGAEHLLQDVELARKRLEQEWNIISENLKTTQSYDAIAPEKSVLRLHLRPLKTLGCPFELVWESFTRSSSQLCPGKDHFVETWKSLRDFIPALDYDAWDQAMASQGYPACHHSTAYREAYSPSYRVVRLDNCSSLIVGQFLHLDRK